MEEDAIELKENSSFEILPSDDEDESYTSSQYSSSTLKDSQFEIVPNSTSALTEEEELQIRNRERNLEILAKHVFSASLEHLTCHLDIEMQSVQNLEFSMNKKQNVEEFLDKSSEDVFSSTVEEKIDPSTLESPDVINTIANDDCQVFQSRDEALRQHQQVEKEETYLTRKGFHNNYPLTIENGNKDCFIFDSITDSGKQRTLDSDFPTGLKGSESNDCPRIRSESAIVQLYPSRQNCPKRLCSVLKQSLKMYRWLRSNKYLQNLVAGAKSSFHSFLNTFEMEVNSMIGMESPLRIIIIANMVEAVPLQEAFFESFCGQVIISRCSEIEDSTIPVLPVGYNSALQALQSKISNARQQYESEKYTVMLSVTPFVVENIPQRWQMSFALCLEDPNLGLNLHNFSLTTPIPNDYISQAQRLTPEDYLLKERGLAVTLEEAIGYAIRTDSKDTQEFLTGVNHFVTLKSAARVLAGMYNKYASRLL